MQVKIQPKLLEGEVKAIPSKSILHRVLIAYFLANQIPMTSSNIDSSDITATKNALKSLRDKDAINCGESGSTLRFLIPLALVINETAIFTGQGRLLQRPLEPYFKIFNDQGIDYKLSDKSLVLNGKLQPGIFNIPGDISSQFISGLLFALPLLDGDSKIYITSPLESRGYVDMTIRVLKDFGLEIKATESGYEVPGNQKYHYDGVYQIESDFSQIAFWLVANCLDSEISVKEINFDSMQPDYAIIDILMKMGAMILATDNSLEVIVDELYGIEIDASNCIDLVPILCVLASLVNGTTTIKNVNRLKYKESDRLMAIVTELKKLSADININNNDIIISGKEHLLGNVVDSHNDHRIAMSLAIAATRCIGNVVINNSECVKKSYPDFYKDYISIGGKVDEFNMG